MEREAILDTELPGEKRYLLVNRLAFSLLFLCVGLPLWYSTTSTYRASLPDKRLAALASAPPLHLDSDPTPRSLFLDPSLPSSFLDELRQNLSSSSSHIRFLDSLPTYHDSSFIHVKDTSFSSSSPLLMDDDKEKVTSFQTASSYEVSFYLVNNDDEGYALDVSKFQNILSKTIVPLIREQFSPLVELDISTEMISDAAHNILPEKAGSRVLEQHQLPFFINKLEHYLHRSTKQYRQKIYFILFVSDKKHAPISIKGSSDGASSLSSSFIVPKWGGVIFFNAHLSQSLDTDLHSIMYQFLTQFNILLGVRSLDDWARVRTVENYAVGRRTLLTLAELLDSIKNIVINDDIATKIDRAITLLETCRQQDHVQCQQGRLLADQVFFDPSLLKLLYFPDDQKFAIYVPLFLPVGAPLAWTLFNDIRLLVNMLKKYRRRTAPSR